MRRIAVGISGASGAIYGIRFLELLRGTPGVESHLIVSAAAKRTIVEETDYTVRDVEALAPHRYSNKDIGASLALESLPCLLTSLDAFAPSGHLSDVRASLLRTRTLVPQLPALAYEFFA